MLLLFGAAAFCTTLAPLGAIVAGDILRQQLKIAGDDLQEVIKLCTGANLGIALQYINMRS